MSLHQLSTQRQPSRLQEQTPATRAGERAAETLCVVAGTLLVPRPASAGRPMKAFSAVVYN